MIDPNITEAQKLDAERAGVAQANADSLCKIMLQHNLTLPNAGRNWRPCVPSRGDIPGIPFTLEILCTDGVVAWFLDPHDRPFYGHIHMFTGEVKPLHGLRPRASAKRAQGEGQDQPTPRPKRVQPKPTASMALELLRRLIGA